MRKIPSIRSPHRSHASFVTHLLGASALMCSVVIIQSAPAGYPACERNRITNLHYECVSPGAQCGANRICKDVSGGSIVAWSDCKCKPGGGARTILAGGTWDALADQPVLPGVPITFTLQDGPENQLELFDALDIDPDGTVAASQMFTGAGDFSGFLTLVIEPGPPDAMPVSIQSVQLSLVSFELFGQPTGVNTIALAAEGPFVAGEFDQFTGAIRFDAAVPCTLSNDLYPEGRELFFHPALGPVEGDSFVLMPSMSLTFPECFGEDDFDSYLPNAALHGISGWKGWDNDPAFGASVDDAVALSGDQSVRIEAASDLVHEVCAVESGRWSLSTWQFIPIDFNSNGGGSFAGSYFIAMNTYTDGGPHETHHWSVQMQFDSNDGLVKVLHGDGLNFISVPYDSDRWVKIQTIIDLDEDWTRIYYDDELVTEYPWTGGVLGDGGGAFDLAAIDLFANGSSPVFYDDLILEPVAALPCPADIDGDGAVDFDDFTSLLAQWGDCGKCSADLDDDGDVDFDDFTALLAAWGPCP